MKNCKVALTAIFWASIFCQPLNAQALFPGGASYPGVECKYDTFDYSSFTPTATTFSGNGLVHTPKGNLNILVLFINYGSDDLAPDFTFPTSPWNHPTSNLPTWLNYTPSCPTCPNAFFNADAGSISATQPTFNLSKYFATFSNPANPFKVHATIYPEQIPVSSAVTDGQAIKDAFAYIRTTNPAFDFSAFDQRTNNPTTSATFSIDNSLSGPDGLLDYVIVFFRKASGNAYNNLQTGTFPIPGTSLSVNEIYGQKHYATFNDMTHTYGAVLHEMAHNFWMSPHYCGANNTHGKQRYCHMYHGMMSRAENSFFTPNAWECWWLGWLAPQEPSVNSVLTLKDFATEHDAIRIRIPGSKQISGKYQYLFIENHQKISPLDEKLLWKSGSLSGCEDMEEGLYMFVADEYGSERNNPGRMGSGHNFIRPLLASGNNDFIDNGLSLPITYFSNNIVWEKKQNPISGNNHFTEILYDDDLNGVIQFTRLTGNSNVPPYDFRHVNTNLLLGLPSTRYYWTGSSTDAFNTLDEIGLSGIVPVLNYPEIISVAVGGVYTEFWEPFYLNGLSVKVLSKNPDGSYVLDIRFDDYEVRNDTRWTGSIVLPDLDASLSTEFMKIKTGADIIVNQSNTLNRATVDPITGTYIYPTKFVIQNKGHLLLDPGSSVTVDENSSFTLQSGAKLEVSNGAVFSVRGNSTLRLEDNSTLIVHDGGRVHIESDGNLEYLKNAKIILDGFNAILEIDGKLYVGNGATFTFTDISGTTVNSGQLLWGHGGTWGPNVYTLGTITTPPTILLEGLASFDQTLVIKDNAFMHLDPAFGNITIRNAFCRFGQSAFLNTGNAGYSFLKVNLSATDPTDQHLGIVVNGQATQQMEQVYISGGKYGIRAYQFWTDGAPLHLKQVTVYNCETGVQVYDKGSFFEQVTLTGNSQYGYRHDMPVFNTQVTSSQLTNNLFRGVSFSSGGANLRLVETDVNQNGVGVEIAGNGMLTGYCSRISNNQFEGIWAKTNSKVDLSNLPSPFGSQFRVLGNGNVTTPYVGGSIRLQFAKGLNLINGQNDLVPYQQNTGKVVRGSLLISVPPFGSMVTDQFYNHWNTRGGTTKGTAPLPYQDYVVSAFPSGAPVLLNDPFRREPLLSCFQGGGGGGGSTLAAILNPVQYCPTCPVLYTPSFSGVPLNVAVQTAISQLEMMDTTHCDLVATDMFTEILTYPVSSPTWRERYLLDIAYDYLKVAYSGACLSGKISTQYLDHVPTPQTPVQKVISAISYQQSLLAPGDDQNRTRMYLDRVMLYNTIGFRLYAYNQLDSLYGVAPVQQQPLIAAHRCQTWAEYQVLNGSVPVWKFDSLLAVCSGGSKMQDGEQDEVEDPHYPDTGIITEPVWSLYPNPANQVLTLEFMTPLDQNLAVTLRDVQGLIVLSDAIVVSAGELNLLNIDVKSLPSGVYMVTVEGAGALHQQRLVIAH